METTARPTGIATERSTRVDAPDRLPAQTDSLPSGVSAVARNPYRLIAIAEPGFISSRALHAWLAAGNEIAEIWCFSESSRLLSRRRSLFGTVAPDWALDQIVRRHRIPVRLCPPLRVWTDAVAHARKIQADLLMTVMTHQIVPEPLIACFGGRAVNIHPALLPHYKGPDPRPAMLVDGMADIHGGVTLHVLTEGLDEGPIIGRRAVPRSVARHFAHWDALEARAAESLVAVELMQFLDGGLVPSGQAPGSGSYRKTFSGEFRIRPEATAAEMKKLCDAYCDSDRVLWLGTDRRGAQRRCGISSFETSLGPPSGEPPRVGTFSVDLDLADARVRLKRRRVLQKAAFWLGRCTAVIRS